LIKNAAGAGVDCEQGRSPLGRPVNAMVFLGLAIFALLVIAAASAGTARAATPTIVNQSSTGGQTNWLESFTTGGEGDGGDNRAQIKISLLVKHDVGRKVTGIKVDDDYDGTDNTSSKTTKNVTAQQPTMQGGYDYSRVTLTYNAPSSGTDLGCNPFGNHDRHSSKSIRVRAVLDNGDQTGTSSSTIKFVATGQCLAYEDYPYIKTRSQSASSIETGDSVTFTYNGDDPDTTGHSDFGGINYRLRRLNDGKVINKGKSCPANGDNANKTLNVTFPDRGRWVVEAELLNNNDCATSDNGGYWFNLGTVDVNSPASSSPTVSLNTTRPMIDGSTTVTATTSDPSDSGQGGQVEAIEWDLNQNTSDGVGGFEVTALGDTTSGITTAQKQRVISTADMTPGLKTVRARVTDNGALGGADTIRRTKTASTTFLVDTPPVALPDTQRTISGDALPFVLAGTDVDSDSLTYSIVTPPAHGTVSGSGASRTYTPDPGYAGTDSLEFKVDDGYGGTATATVDFRVDPDLRPFDGPSGTVDSRGGEIEFDSSATGATFECQLDDDAWQTCTSPFDVTDLPDGEHTLRARVTAGGLTNPDVREATWTVDAYPKVTLDSGPAPTTNQTSAAFDFHLGQDGATVTPTAECQIDDLAWVPCAGTIAYDDVDDGLHTFRVRGTDAFGKQAVADITWEVLTDGGSTAIEAPLPASYTRQTTAQVNFSTNGPSDHAECSLDGDAWQTCVSPAELTGLGEGVHTLRVRSVNQLGDPSPQPAQISWTVDRTIPVAKITAGPQGSVPNGPATFTFESNESFSSFECKLDAGEYAPCVSPFHLPADISDGYHSFRVAAIDRAGNRSLAPQRDFKLLSVAPAVEFTSGPAQGQVIRATAASFGFTAAAAVPGFECSVDGGDYAPCASPAAVTGLADGAHSISVRSIDEVGNRSAEAATRSWTVDATPPGTAITAGPSAKSKSAEASFSFSSSEAGSGFECSLDDAAFAACTSPQEFEGLSDGNHQFRVRSIDPAGNVDPTPESLAWEIDTTDPGPPDPPLTDPETLPCDFSLQQERCGDPYLTGSARASYRNKRGKGQIKFEVSSGGAALSRILVKTPAGLKATAFSGKSGRKVGQVVLTGSASQTIALKLPDKVKAANPVAGSDGGPKVMLKQRAVVITNLPEGVTGAKIKIKSSRGLGISASVCGTRAWRAKLTDAGSTSRQVTAKGDTNCVRKGNR